GLRGRYRAPPSPCCGRRRVREQIIRHVRVIAERALLEPVRDEVEAEEVDPWTLGDGAREADRIRRVIGIRRRSYFRSPHRTSREVFVEERLELVVDSMHGRIHPAIRTDRDEVGLPRIWM